MLPFRRVYFVWISEGFRVVGAVKGWHGWEVFDGFDVLEGLEFFDFFGGFWIADWALGLLFKIVALFF